MKVIFLRLTEVFMQIRCNFPNILYLSEKQKNNFQFLSVYISFQMVFIVSRVP